jgi:hypothetical protein
MSIMQNPFAAGDETAVLPLFKASMRGCGSACRQA